MAGAWSAIYIARRFFLDGFQKALELKLPSLRLEIEEIRAEKRARLSAEEREPVQESPQEMAERMLRESSLGPSDPDNPLGPVPPMPDEVRRRRG